MKILIRSFRAIDRPDLCEQFRIGHVKVLTDYGITHITTNNSEWMNHPGMYVIMAYNETRTELLGGIRIQVADGKVKLPLEIAIGKLDIKVYDLISKYINDGTGELCALWNAKEVAGKGISLILIRAGISIVNQIKLRSLFIICGDFTMHMVSRVGFEVENSLGKNGDFIYPKDDLIARVLKRLNTTTLEAAQPYDRERMLSLRLNPQQVFEEVSTKENVTVDYNLILSNFDK